MRSGLTVKNQNVIFFIVAVSLIVLTGIFHTELNDSLRYERAALFQGEYWRVLTAHFVHLNIQHGLMNLAAFAVLWFFFMRQHENTHWWLYALSCCIAVSTGLLLFNPELEWYVGLSGCLHGLIAIIALIEIRQSPAIGIALLVGLAVKLAWEQMFGPLAGSQELIRSPVIVDAHLYGAISACFLWPIGQVLNSYINQHEDR